MKAVRLLLLWFALLPGCQEPMANPEPKTGPKTEEKQPTDHLHLYRCRKTQGKITINAGLAEPDWQRAETIELAAFPWQEQTGGLKQRTFAKLLWDDRFLYVAFVAQDVDITGERKPRDQEVWMDDCVEVFLDPEEADGEYLGFEVNAQGSLFDYRAKLYRELDISYSPNNVDVASYLERRRNDPQNQAGKYVIEMRIPLSALTGRKVVRYKLAKEGPAEVLPVKPGTTVGLGLYRVDHNTIGGQKTIAYSLWKAPWTDRPDFHLLSTFGRLVFVED